MRKELPLVITLVGGLLAMFGKWVVWGDAVKVLSYTDKFQTLTQATALLVGALNLTRIHGLNIQRRRGGYGFSVVLVVAMWGYFIFGLINGYNGKDFRWVYSNLIRNMDSTMFSMLCFYIASAAYRAFRIRTREATVLLVAAAVVMLGKAPLGETIWAGFGNWMDWIMRVPNTAAMRGILIGAYLGGFVTALRILLGIERAHLGGMGGSVH